MDMNSYVRETGSHVSKATIGHDLHPAYIVTWRGNSVYGKEFPSERAGYDYLAACDAAGRILP